MLMEGEGQAEPQRRRRGAAVRRALKAEIRKMDVAPAVNVRREKGRDDAERGGAFKLIPPHKLRVYYDGTQLFKAGRFALDGLRAAQKLLYRGVAVAVAEDLKPRFRRTLHRAREPFVAYAFVITVSSCIRARHPRGAKLRRAVEK